MKESHSGVSLFISLIILDSELKLRHSQFGLINSYNRTSIGEHARRGVERPWETQSMEGLTSMCMDPNSLWLVSGYLIVIHAWRYKSSS